MAQTRIWQHESNTNMENEMNLKRAFLILMATMTLPGVALAQDLSIGMTATVDFTDSNATEMITVDFSCNDGSNPVGQAMLGDGDSFRHPNDGMSAGFVCTVTGSDINANYSVTYNGETDPCEFTAADLGEGNSAEVTCAILASPDGATITVTKDWNLEGAGGEVVVTMAEVEARAAAGALVGGGLCTQQPLPTTATCVYLSFSGETDDASVSVNTDVAGVEVTFTEVGDDSSIEVTNGCGTIEVFPGDDVDCTITNTVFFEGIPTLSQYGMAIMVLLMLGVGFVGFRRFV
jgi:hypothetical protein